MRYLIGFALLLPMVVFAKDPPLPEALLNAKTAFIEKVGTAEESFDKYCTAPKANAGAADKEHDKYCKSLKKDAKADKQLFDNFCKELNKWGRFTLVQDRSSADVRILLGRTSGTPVIKTFVSRDVPGWWRSFIADCSRSKCRSVPIATSDIGACNRKKVFINIRDGRNDALLYLEQKEEPDYLFQISKKR